MNKFAYDVAKSFMFFGIVMSWAEFCELSEQDVDEPNFTLDDLMPLLHHYAFMHGDKSREGFTFSVQIDKFLAQLSYRGV